MLTTERTIPGSPRVPVTGISTLDCLHHFTGGLLSMTCCIQTLCRASCTPKCIPLEQRRCRERLAQDRTEIRGFIHALSRLHEVNSSLLTLHRRLHGTFCHAIHYLSTIGTNTLPLEPGSMSHTCKSDSLSSSLCTEVYVAGFAAHRHGWTLLLGLGCLCVSMCFTGHRAIASNER